MVRACVDIFDSLIKDFDWCFTIGSRTIPELSIGVASHAPEAPIIFENDGVVISCTNFFSIGQNFNGDFSVGSGTIPKLTIMVMPGCKKGGLRLGRISLIGKINLVFQITGTSIGKK